MIYRDVPLDGIPVIQAKDIRQKNLRTKVDVVIVGSGAGGAVMAFELAKAGKKVLVLEAGPYVASAHFTERLGDSMKTLYQDAGVQPSTLGDLSVLQGACVGGSSVVNATICFRTPDYVLKDWQENHGLKNLTTTVLNPYFSKIEKRLHIHDNQPHEINACAQRIVEGCDAMGISWKPVKRNVKQCALTGHCLSGCPSDRKMSMLVTYLPWAISYGAQIYADTKVVRVNENGCRAVGVQAEIIDPITREKKANLKVDAQVVVLAAGAIQTPLLLQRSELCTESGWLGQNFSAHPFVSVVGKFKKPVYGWRGALTGIYIDEYTHPKNGGYLFESGLAGPEQLLTQSEHGVGSAHLDFMKDYKYYSAMNAFVHDHGEGEVIWKGAAEDGDKKIQWEMSRDIFENLKKAVKIAGRVYFAAGADNVYLPTHETKIVNSVFELDHMVNGINFGLRGLYTFRVNSVDPQGTTRMGIDPESSVVNANGETHSVKGLFVADASLFPSELTVNPQLSVYAISNYIADHIINNQKSYFI